MTTPDPQDLAHTPANGEIAAAPVAVAPDSVGIGPGPGTVVLIPMRWGDMDSYGHVNNVEVVRMLEEARIAAFGVPVGAGHQVRPPVVPLFDTLPDGTQALIAEHRIKYLKALEYRNVAAPVRVWIVRAAGAALILGIEIHDAATGQVCVRAHTQLAFFDPAEQRVLRLTKQQQEALEPWAGPPLFR